jgi:hypothetical protein
MRLPVGDLTFFGTGFLRTGELRDLSLAAPA